MTLCWHTYLLKSDEILLDIHPKCPAVHPLPLTCLSLNKITWRRRFKNLQFVHIQLHWIIIAKWFKLLFHMKIYRFNNKPDVCHLQRGNSYMFLFIISGIEMLWFCQSPISQNEFPFKTLSSLESRGSLLLLLAQWLSNISILFLRRHKRRIRYCS